MDISSIASAATGMAQANLKNSVEMAVLKKAINLQSQGALQLVQSAVNTGKQSNPSHLGNIIDLTA